MTNYRDLIDKAVAKGDLISAEKYERERNAKIDNEGLNYAKTYDYQTNYARDITNGIAQGADVATIQNLLNARTQKASVDDSLKQYQYDDVYQNAMNYIKTNGGKGFSYEDAPTYGGYGPAPTYTNRYDSQIQNLLGTLTNREAFTWSPETDPLYAAAKKQVYGNAARTQADALGQYAAMTGGMPSTAAVAAASQAGDNARGQLFDIQSDLYNRAANAYQMEGNRLLNNMDVLRALEGDDYNKYKTKLNQYNIDRDFDYQQYLTDLDQYNIDRNFAYGQYSDDWNRTTTDQDRAYQMSQDAKNWDWQNKQWDYQTAAAKAGLLAAAGDFSGYKALGYTDDEINTLRNAWLIENGLIEPTGGSSGGSGGGGYRYYGGKDAGGLSEEEEANKKYIQQRFGLGNGTELTSNQWRLLTNNVPDMSDASLRRMGFTEKKSEVRK